MLLVLPLLSFIWVIFALCGTSDVVADFFVPDKGFIVKYNDLEAFVSATGVDKAALEQTYPSFSYCNNSVLLDFNASFVAYSEAADKGQDEFGKTTFPVKFDQKAPLNVLIVTPSIHYTMGGALISSEARVLNFSNSPIPGLYLSKRKN